jgi:hypothetical protein
MTAPDPRPSPQRVLRECRSCQSARSAADSGPRARPVQPRRAILASGSRSSWMSGGGSVGVCLMRFLRGPPQHATSRRRRAALLAHRRLQPPAERRTTKTKHVRRNGHARAGSARDDPRTDGAPSAKPATEHVRLQHFLRPRPLLVSRAGLAREIGGRPAVVCAKTGQQKVRICRMFSTGATGLEPATSGVTGRFEGRRINDGGRAIALLMGDYGKAASRSAWSGEPEFRRLLPVCCPSS